MKIQVKNNYYCFKSKKSQNENKITVPSNDKQ